jgi:hypothetical protein
MLSNCLLASKIGFCLRICLTMPSARAFLIFQSRCDLRRAIITPLVRVEETDVPIQKNASIQTRPVRHSLNCPRRWISRHHTPWFVWLLMFCGEVSSREQTGNPEIDHDRVHKYSRDELCRTKHLEPCRFRNPMNNDCGARAIHYRWCMNGDDL